MTSWPREMRSLPKVSAQIMGLPPGLSVILAPWILGCSTRRRARVKTLRLFSSVRIPRDVTNSTMFTNSSDLLSKWRKDALCHPAPVVWFGILAMEANRFLGTKFFEFCRHLFKLTALDKDFKKIRCGL